MKYLKTYEQVHFYADGTSYYDDYNDFNEEELSIVNNYKFKIGDYVKINNSVVIYQILAVTADLDKYYRYKVGRVDNGFGTNRVSEKDLTLVSELEKDAIDYNL